MQPGLLDFCGLAPAEPNRSVSVLLAGNMARDVVMGATGLLPNLGGDPVTGLGGFPTASVAKGFITLMWEAKTDLWSLLGQHIEALVRGMINQQELKQLTSDLKGLRDSWKLYAEETPDNPQKGGLLGALILQFTDQRHRFFDAGCPEQTLPHLAAMGTMHLLLLYDQTSRFRESYGGDDSQAAVHLTELREMTAEYQRALGVGRAKAIEQRRALVKLGGSTTSGSGYNWGWTRTIHRVWDEMGGGQQEWEHYVSAGPTGTTVRGADAYDQARAYQDRLRDQRAAELNGNLDRFLASTRAWRLFDPEEPRLPPSPTPLSGTQLGAAQGTEVAATLPAGAALVSVAGAFDGNRLKHLTLGFRGADGVAGERTLGAGGATAFRLVLQPGECVTAACVAIGAGVEGILFLSNLAGIGGGGRTGGQRTLLTAPGSDPAGLCGVRGWIGDDGTFLGLQLEWRVVVHLERPSRVQVLRIFRDDRMGGVPEVLNTVSEAVWEDFFTRFRGHPTADEAARTEAYVLQNAVTSNQQDSVGSAVWAWAVSNAEHISMAAVDSASWNGFMDAFQAQDDAESGVHDTSYLLQNASLAQRPQPIDYQHPDAAWVWGWVDGHRRALYTAGR